VTQTLRKTLLRKKSDEALRYSQPGNHLLTVETNEHLNMNLAAAMARCNSNYWLPNSLPSLVLFARFNWSLTRKLLSFFHALLPRKLKHTHSIIFFEDLL
jgi:hypothetical protein